MTEEPFARDCGGDANAVRGLAIGCHGAAVLETSEGGESVVEDLVRGLGRELRDKPDAAGIEVETWIDKAAFDLGRHRDPRVRLGR